MGLRDHFARVLGSCVCAARALALSNSLGVEIDIQNALFEFADYGTWNLILINKLPMAIELKNPNGEIVAFPTLKGILIKV